jgi:NAD(P)-dependent dehydrogenase (short-subunit alcohol dehydrogenase family)
MEERSMSAQVILITGTSRGLGREMRRHLSAKGHIVYGSARASAPADANHLQLDVTDVAACQTAVSTVLEREGRIDVLINNAGSHLLGAALETTADELRAQLELNFFGSVNMIQAALPSMLESKHGRIINMSSTGGRLATPFTAAYCASKFALEGYTEALRLELLAHSVFVTNLEPGYLNTGTADQSIVQVRNDHALYAEARRAVWARMQADSKKGLPLARVTATIDRVIAAKRPKLRYTIDGLATRLEMLRALMPSGTFERTVITQTSPGLGRG